MVFGSIHASKEQPALLNRPLSAQNMSMTQRHDTQSSVDKFLHVCLSDNLLSTIGGGRLWRVCQKAIVGL